MTFSPLLLLLYTSIYTRVKMWVILDQCRMLELLRNRNLHTFSLKFNFTLSNPSTNSVFMNQVCPKSRHSKFFILKNLYFRIIFHYCQSILWYNFDIYIECVFRRSHTAEETLKMWITDTLCMHTWKFTVRVLWIKSYSKFSHWYMLLYVDIGSLMENQFWMLLLLNVYVCK